MSITDAPNWVLGQIAEDRRRAQAADVKQTDPSWTVHEVAGTEGEHYTVRSEQDHRPIAAVQRLDGDDGEPAGILDGASVATHIATWDPKRVLAQCDASEQLVRDYIAVVFMAAFNRDKGLPPDEPDRKAKVLKPAFDALLQVYADRPGYCEEWRS